MAKQTKRDDELSSRPKIAKKLLDLFRDIEKGFADQYDRSDNILDYTDIYNCVLGEKQFYNGDSQIFVPIVRDAVDARQVRFTNQIFPQSGRFVEVTTQDGDVPHATMALAEHYVKKARLRTQVVPALCVNGDLEGQYSVYVGWHEGERHVTSREIKPVVVADLEFPELGEVETMVHETVPDDYATVEVLHDADLLVLPATCDSIEEAIEGGGSVSIRRRWTKGKIRQMIDDGEFEEDAGEALLKNMSKKDWPGSQDILKRIASNIGIQSGNSGKYCMGVETWTMLKIDGVMRLCRAYYGGDDQILGCKLNPYWCDKCPVISAPVRKLAGVFKGRPPVANVADLQYLANDTINEGADTSHYSAMPIIMTDPEKNPKYGTMVLGKAAVWETSPKDTSFAQFPALWEKSLELVSQIQAKVFQTLGVNPAMIPQNTGGKQKRNQAEIANEQQVDILTTADAVTVLEDGILSPIIQRFIDYDRQFRIRPVLIRSMGEMGMRAIMEEIPPIQDGNRYEYRWYGVEAARNAAQIQQQIAMMNVLKAIPPQMYPGHKLNAVPIMTQLVENTFGPRLAPLVFTDMRDQVSMDPEIENKLMAQGFEARVHELDDDQKHLQSHQQALSMGDPQLKIAAHIQMHLMQIQAKGAQMQAGAQQKGLPGAPGGDGPGQAGSPRPGAQPAGPRLIKGPEGMINPDQMPAAGAVGMPRKF